MWRTRRAADLTRYRGALQAVDPSRQAAETARLPHSTEAFERTADPGRGEDRAETRGPSRRPAGGLTTSRARFAHRRPLAKRRIALQEWLDVEYGGAVDGLEVANEDTVPVDGNYANPV